jgi:hypothetical protein
MNPIVVPRRPSADEIARRIRFLESADTIHRIMKQDNYNPDRIMDLYKLENQGVRELTIEALLNATETRKITIDKGNGREIWKRIIEEYSNIKFDDRSTYEVDEIRRLYSLCHPPYPVLRDFAKFTVGFGLTFLSAMSFGLDCGFWFKIADKFIDNQNVKYLKKRLRLSKR